MKAKKITAAFTLSAIMISSCQPVFADLREEKLDQREKMLTERAVLISEKSVDLDDREQELRKRSAELDELSKAIQSRNVEASVREIELDELKANLNRDSALLASQTQELDRNREELASYRAEAEKRAGEAELLANEAEGKLKEAEKHEALIARQKKELSEREEEIEVSLIQIKVAREELAGIQKASSDVAMKIAQLDREKKNLEAEQSIYAAEKAKLEKDKADISTLKAERDKAINEAKKLTADAEELSRKIEEYIAISNQQEGTIARLSADLVLKNNELLAVINQNTVGDNEPISVLFVDVKGNESYTRSPSGNGIMNWSDGSVRAIGQGVPPKNIDGAQGKILARRAAVVDLQRNILETVKGVQIDSRTKVSELALKYDVIDSKVSGTISGVEVIDEKWDEEEKIYTVAGQIRKEGLSGVMSEVAKHVSSSGKKPASRKNPPKNAENYTGLILDVRHLGVSQQKFFRIVDEKGNLVYGLEYADKNKQAREGLCVYYRRIVMTADEKDRVGDKPLVIKAQRFASNGEDIVVPNSEAEKIRTNKADFLKDCKVIVVMS